MNRKHLLQTAKELGPFSQAAFNAYRNNEERLLFALNSELLSREDIKNLVGETNIQMMKDNHTNHYHFILSMLKNYNSEILIETILWVFRAYRSRGFTTNYWAAQLNTWRTVIEKTIEEESKNEILALYTWMQINIPVFTMLSDEKLEDFNQIKISH